jgi:hypothetical protein
MTKVNRRTAVFTTQRSLKLATITTLAACLPTSSQSTYSVILAAGISLVPCADAFVLMHGRIAGGNHLRTWRRRAGEESYSDEEDGMQVPRSRKKVQLESYGFEGRSQPRSQGKQRYVDELSKSELFSRLTEKGSTHHDDVVIRSSRGGRQLSVPQAERYRSSDWCVWSTRRASFSPLCLFCSRSFVFMFGKLFSTTRNDSHMPGPTFYGRRPIPSCSGGSGTRCW